MKNNKFFKAIAITATLLLVGCEGATENSSSINQEVTPVGIVISSVADVRTITEGATLQLTAVVHPEGASQNVIWSSSDTTIATVSSAGLVTAIKAGNVNITATAENYSTITQTFALIVEEGEEEVITPTNITITAENDATSLKAGTTLNLTATVAPEGASQDVDWSSSNVSVAIVKSGIVTGLTEGSVTIIATSKSVQTVTGSITLTIEKADAPATTVEWENMSYATHDEYISAEKTTALKIKGVVTHVSPVDAEYKVNYYIQNGTEGYYVYGQDYPSLPVQEGKVYEVGGFKDLYRGAHELKDVELCKELDENITWTPNELVDIDPEDVTAMTPYYSSIVSGTAIIESLPTSTTKAYSLDVSVNGYSTDFRVDPSSMSEEEFAAINEKINNALVGNTFTFKGASSAFGYGKPSNQILILKSADLVFAAPTDESVVNAAKEELFLDAVVDENTNSISLPTSFEAEKFNSLSIAWNSSNPDIIATDGTVTHPEKDAVVTLTATFKSGDVEDTKTFKVIVYGSNNNYTNVLSLDLEDALPANDTTYGNSATKNSYATANVTLGGATWKFQNALIGGDSNDRRNGIFSARLKANSAMNTTGRLELQEDKDFSVVDFKIALYSSNAPGAKVFVEYSTDQGSTWIDSEYVFVVTSTSLQQCRVLLPEGNKRVTIYLEVDSGVTINIDDIVLMK